MFPLDAFVLKVITRLGIRLGQLAPNFYSQIYIFLDRCVLKGITPEEDIFKKYHNIHSTGYVLYTIRGRKRRIPWIMKNFNKGWHEDWAFVFLSRFKSTPGLASTRSQGNAGAEIK